MCSQKQTKQGVKYNYFLLFIYRDLSENLIQSIPRKAFRGATDIKNL